MGYLPEGWTAEAFTDLVRAGQGRGLSIRLPQTDRREIFHYGHPTGRMPEETEHTQVWREQHPEGRRLSAVIRDRRAMGWDDVAVTDKYGKEAAQIRSEVVMVADTDRDKVMERIDRMGIPGHFRELFSALPVAVLAKALMSAPVETRFPAEPPEKSVLMWLKTHPGSDRTYTYVALRAGDMWWVSGLADRNPSPVDWDYVEKEIGNGQCWLATDWGEVPQIPATPFEGMDPKTYFEQIILGSDRRGSVDAES